MVSGLFFTNLHTSFAICLDLSEAVCITEATEGEASAAADKSEAEAEARVGRAIDDGFASFSAGFASGLEAFSEVRWDRFLLPVAHESYSAGAGRVGCGKEHCGGQDGSVWGVQGNRAERRRSRWRR